MIITAPFAKWCMGEGDGEGDGYGGVDGFLYFSKTPF